MNLFKIVYEEYINPTKSLEINKTYTLYVKLHNDCWYPLYTTFSEEWIKLALNKYKEYLDVYVDRFIEQTDLPVMFEINGQIYKTAYVFPKQSCICGETIPGNQRYGEFSIEPIKYDYIRSNIFFYNRDEFLVKCNQLFANGELLADSKTLKGICNTIGQEWSALDSNPDKLIDYIEKTYTKYFTYTCNGYNSSKYKLRDNEKIN